MGLCGVLRKLTMMTEEQGRATEIWILIDYDSFCSSSLVPPEMLMTFYDSSSLTSRLIVSKMVDNRIQSNPQSFPEYPDIPNPSWWVHLRIHQDDHRV